MRSLLARRDREARCSAQSSNQLGVPLGRLCTTRPSRMFVGRVHARVHVQILREVAKRTCVFVLESLHQICQLH